MKIPSENYIIKTFTLVFIILIFINQGMAQNTIGLIMNDAAQSYNGYTLFAPNTSKVTYLIDNEGRLVNKWESDFVPGLSAYLLEDGHLLRSAALQSEDPNVTRTGGFQKFEWDGTLVWNYYHGTQHHDIEPLPNGNVLMVVNDRKNKNAAIQAGRDPDFIGDNIRSLSIVEIKQTGFNTGEIVWQWNAWDHLIQDFDDSKDNFGTVVDHPELMDINFAKDRDQDWLHTNSVDYNEEFDQILVSNRGTHEIWIIDHSTASTEVAASHEGGNSGMGGDLLYRWGNPISYEAGTVGNQLLYAQHDAHWVESGLRGVGNILIFNNGIGRPSGSFSSVDEIIPPADANGNYSLVSGPAYLPTVQTWIYTNNTPADFNSPRYGSTQRLPNGNTLICNSDSGEFFEVNQSDEIVWKYINPVVRDSIIPQGTTNIDNNQVFRCYKYGADYPGLPTDLVSGEPLGIFDDLNKLSKFKLFDNYPNPFNPTTAIEFVISEREFVKITVFDMLGNEVQTLVSRIMEPGIKSVNWNSKDDTDRMVSSGVYFYSIQAGEFIQTKKMLLLR